MKHVLITPIIILVCMNFSAYSQTKLDSANNFVYTHNLGFETGVYSELTLTYRYMSGLFGIQGNIGGQKNSYVNEFIIGETIRYSLYRNTIIDIFAFQSNFFKYKFDKSNYYNYGYYTPEPTPKESYQIINTLGFGVEFIFLHHVSLNGMVGYGAADNFNEIGAIGTIGGSFKF